MLFFLWLNDNHYDLILSPKGFSELNLSQFCFKCMRYYAACEYANTHVCRTAHSTCLKCYGSTKCEDEKDFKIKCTSCCVVFRNKTCFQNHLFEKIFKGEKSNGGKITPCQYMFFCETCYKITPRFIRVGRDKTAKHDCEKSFCFHCNKHLKRDHQCFIKPLKSTADSVKPTLYFYDFETKTDENGFMIPFYCVVQKVCILCDKTAFIKNFEHFVPYATIPFCDTSIDSVTCCGHRQYVFERNNDSIVSEFVDFMLKQPKNSVWVAHNGGRFDSIFLLRELLVNKKIVPETIMNGNKIMCISIPECNLKVVDSYMFLGMKLSKFPEALGVEDLTKGYHPYRFTDLNYVGPMISLDYFDMPVEKPEKDLFDLWYSEQCKKPYIFRDAIYYYCRMDVDILRRGCVIFAHLIKEITSVFPFYDKTCNTIAGLALKIYRTMFLKKTHYRTNSSSGIQRECKSKHDSSLLVIRN